VAAGAAVFVATGCATAAGDGGTLAAPPGMLQAESVMIRIKNKNWRSIDFLGMSHSF
jgi:hypothetical protein